MSAELKLRMRGQWPEVGTTVTRVSRWFSLMMSDSKLGVLGKWEGAWSQNSVKKHGGIIPLPGSGGQGSGKKCL